MTYELGPDEHEDKVSAIYTAYVDLCAKRYEALRLRDQGAPWSVIRDITGLSASSAKTGDTKPRPRCEASVIVRRYTAGLYGGRFVESWSARCGHTATPDSALCTHADG